MISRYNHKIKNKLRQFMNDGGKVAMVTFDPIQHSFIEVNLDINCLDLAFAQNVILRAIKT